MKKINNDTVILIEEKLLEECMEFIENNSNSIYAIINNLINNKYCSLNELEECLIKLDSIRSISKNLKDNNQLDASLELIH